MPSMRPTGPKIIADRILLIRGKKVIVDADLADLYGVTSKRLKEQVRRNISRFPNDFMFPLTVAEQAEVAANCGHLRNLKFSPIPPLAFTEHGALMAASVLNTRRAVEVSLYVVRAFVRLRELFVEHKDVAAKLMLLERSIEDLAHQHEALAGATRLQFRELFQALRELTRTPNPPTKRPIGFITEGTKKGSTGRAV